MRRINHLTPRYIINRAKLFIYEKRHPQDPWLTEASISFLREWIRPMDCGLEFGSGRSTVWLASRMHRLISVEHDPTWYERVGKLVEERGLASRVDRRLLNYSDAVKGPNPYLDFLHGIPDQSLDFCLVDGMCRDKCAWQCLSKVRQGGILAIDNINWYLPRRKPSTAPDSRSLRDGCASETWERVRMVLAEWRLYWTTNGITDTALWIKPNGPTPSPESNSV
jgi:predicted O-methyltransferase YrrM